MSSTRHDLDLSPAGIARRNFIKGTAAVAAASTLAPLAREQLIRRARLSHW